MNHQILLNELLAGYAETTSPMNPSISGLSQDSRTIKPGDIFFAYPGQSVDGRQYISHAIKNGAAAVAMESNEISGLSHFEGEYKVPVVPIENIQNKLSALASRFYRDPSKDMLVFGVTGTNGKTSISHFLTEIGEKLGYRAAMIGTLGYGALNSLQKTLHTTPDAIEIQRIFAELRDKGIHWVAMEVSSHGLDQGRVNAIQFETAFFSNLTRDHLDYHGSMEAYGAAKAKLFHLPGLKHAVINCDDKFGWQLLHRLPVRVKRYGFSALGHIGEGAFPVIHSVQSHLNASGITASISSPWGQGILQSRLMGRFYLSNLLAVLTQLGIMGCDFQDILHLVSTLQPIPGRMQPLGHVGRYPLIIVDYAHTPDALKQVLLALREHCTGNLWCVFGCGGDRDKGKRPEMGAIAEQYSDYVVITNDNPRTEDPLQITNEIKAGILMPQKVVIEHDRFQAILHAIQSAKSDDIVLIAGKGHENYQIIGTEKKPFSDVIAVQMILAESI